METVIITDSHSDFPLELIKKYNIPFLGPMCNFNGEEIEDDLGQGIPYREFYNAVRKGEMPTTAQINVYRYERIFEKYIKEGKAIIYICFSSALSGSINSARLAREEVLEQNKGGDITIIDSKSASLGQGLLVYYAYEMLKGGSSKEEIIEWVESNKLKVNHWFTVDDLNHLKRGGRISPTAALMGTMLSFKPILKINNDGELISHGKVRGRKKALKILVDTMKEKIVNPKEQVVFISHGDCLEEVLKLKDIICSEMTVKEVIINPIGCAVGTHAGPNAIAVFFLGEER